MTLDALDSLNTQKNESKELNCGKTLISPLSCQVESDVLVMDNLSFFYILKEITDNIVIYVPECHT